MPTSKKRKPTTPLKRHANAALVPEGSRSCPICRQPMQTEQRDDDAVDVCAEHGVWLDRFELERMFLRRARNTGRRIDRIRRAERTRTTALAAMYWGILL